jgi:hypothetical protein
MPVRIFDNIGISYMKLQVCVQYSNIPNKLFLFLATDKRTGIRQQRCRVHFPTKWMIREPLCVNHFPSGTAVTPKLKFLCVFDVSAEFAAAIGGSYGGAYNFCNATPCSLVVNVPTFQKNLLPNSSDYVNI